MQAQKVGVILKKSLKLLLYVLGGVAGIWLTVKFLLPVGLPFLLGLALARLAERPVNWLREKSKLPRWLCTFLVVSLIFAAFGGIFWLLGRLLFSKLEQFAGRLPELLPMFSDALSQLQKSLQNLADKLPDTLSAAASQWLEQLFAGSSVVMDTASGWLIGLVGGILSRVPDLLFFLLTMLLSAYLFSSQWPQLHKKLQKRIPKRWQERGRAIGKRLKNALGGYLKAQCYLSGVTFLLLLLGLFFLIRSKAVLAALVISLLDALPVFGAGAALIPWSIFAFLQGDTFLALGLLLLYALCAILRSFLEPRFLGKQMGLHPLLTLLSLYGGYRFFGVAGMILVPIGVILVKQLYDLVESS